MCEFFSAISNGQGKTLFFKLEDIVNIMAEGNPKVYDWNSHTSIADYYGLRPVEEDKWNKWEYDPEKKELKIDQLNTKNDKNKVLKAVEEYFENKNIVYIRNIYNWNSGYRNSGNWNSGDRNSGYRNSGNWNSGDRNSGNWNSGYSNSGNWNSGYRNSGYRNSGNWNSGDRNSGNWNSGNWNSGDRNSGNWNSGDRNSGYLNTNEPDRIRVFNKFISIEEYEQIEWPDFFYFDLTIWVSHDTATEAEKEQYKQEIETCGGYLKTLSYKEAWQKSYEQADQEDRDKVKKIPNFDSDLFYEITRIIV